MYITRRRNACEGKNKRKGHEFTTLADLTTLRSRHVYERGRKGKDNSQLSGQGFLFFEFFIYNYFALLLVTRT